MPGVVARREEVSQIVTVRDRLNDVQVFVVNVGAEVFVFAPDIHVNEHRHQLFFDVFMRLQPEAIDVGDRFDSKVSIAEIPLQHFFELHYRVRGEQFVDQLAECGKLVDVFIGNVKSKFGIQTVATVVGGASSIECSRAFVHRRGDDFGQHFGCDWLFNDPVCVRKIELCC